MEDIIYYNQRQRFALPKKIEPQVDEIVSKIVGKKIYQLDPRLLKLIVKWKQGKDPDSMEPDNFFHDPAKIKELQEVLNKPL